MISLKAIHQPTLQEVTKRWNAFSEALGLEVVQPLEPGKQSWNNLRLAGSPVFVSTRKPYNLPRGEDLVWVELYRKDTPKIAFEQVFEKVLALPLGATEVILTNSDSELMWPLLTCFEESFDDFQDALLENEASPELRSLRAYHENLITAPEHWMHNASKRGLPTVKVGPYWVVDLHWKSWHGDPQSEGP